LDKLIWAAAYEAHPYHHPVIGWRSDIENVSIQKLHAFYDTFYWPNNATVTVVGDIDPKQVLGQIRKDYGTIPRSPQAIPVVYTTEPKQEGPRRVLLERTGDTASVSVNWKSPSALDPDMPALTMLELVLSQGKSSRLSRALVDTSLASRASANAAMLHDPGLFSVDALVAPGVSPEKVEKVILDEVERVKRDGVTAAEMQRVLGPYRADVAYRRDGTGSAAGALNEYIAMGDWTLYVTYLAKLEKVTPADVQRVASKYLNKDQSTTGWFVPEASK
jgi:zinc protease